jgi:probable HAF family extracellular repeat protein
MLSIQTPKGDPKMKQRYGKKAILSFTTAIVFVIAFSGMVVAQEYSVTALGTLGGLWSGANEIDNQGRVVGGSTVDSGPWHAFMWSNGVMNDLSIPPGHIVSEATGFNTDGQLVGYATGQYQEQHAYFWENGDWTYLGTLPGGLQYSRAVDINDLSQIAGNSFVPGTFGEGRAWIWEDNVMTDLGALGGLKSFAAAINEQGQVVGHSDIFSPDMTEFHAFIWQDNVMTDLGVLPGEVNSAANDVNEAGQICGSSSHPMDIYPFSEVPRPCVWDNGQIIDLGLLPGHVKGKAMGINANGQVVGWMATTEFGSPETAFIWEDGVLKDLNESIPPQSDWILQSASDINDNGQIIGSGVSPGGTVQAFLLTPAVTGVENDLENQLPTDFISSIAYPNPFNARTTIDFDLSSASKVSIGIYDLTGRKVESLMDARLPAGNHQATWDADRFSSGVYFYRIQAGNYSESRKMVLLK